MILQARCPKRCKVTFVACEFFFCSVGFQMWRQMVFPKRCIVALVAFVYLLSFFVYSAAVGSFSRRSVHTDVEVLTTIKIFLAIGHTWLVELSLLQTTLSSHCWNISHLHYFHNHFHITLQYRIYGRFFWMSTRKPLTFEKWNSGESNNFQ